MQANKLSPGIVILNYLQTRYPIQVARLLEHYKLDETKPVESIGKGIELFGEQFLEDLYKITEAQSLNAEGEKPEEKKQWLQILQGAFGAGNALLNKPKKPDPEVTDEKSKSWIWIGIGFILLLIFILTLIVVKNGK